MTTRSKTKLSILVGTLLLFGWWVSDIPIGYYQFKQMCKKEGGLRSYTKVEVNVGWLAASEPDAQGIVSSYPTVPFARFRANDGSWKDVSYKGGNPWWSSSYEITSADETKVPRYHLVLKVESVAGAIRLRREVLTLSDESPNQIVFQTTRFIFTWTNPENTLLGMSDTAECPAYKDEVLSIKSFLKLRGKL